MQKKIFLTLSLYNLDPKSGASAMSGHCSGVQQHIREETPHALYVHCHTHVLNLVLVDCIKKNSFAFEFFSLLESLYAL